MRAAVCAIVAAIGLAHPALAQPGRDGAAFWKSVQATCNATAAKPSGDLGKRIAQSAITEFDSFGGHKIDANGRLFHFGLTEAEHEEDDGGSAQTSVGKLGWWQVMKYWRSLFDNNPNDKLEVRGYRDASTTTDPGKATDVLRPDAATLLRAADAATDPETREVLREAALRAAIIDTSWSAAFISYVIKEAGVAANAFHFSNAHRAYIYDAFATSAAELKHETRDDIYRACPAGTTKPRVGDIICAHREPSLADTSDEKVREKIMDELASGTDKRSVRRAHCEVVAYIDAPARKVYTISGNADQAVTTRKMNLRRGLKFQVSQKGHCSPSEWTMPRAANNKGKAEAPEKCSLNDKNWFVLLQLR